MKRSGSAMRAFWGALVLPMLGNAQELVFDASFNASNGVEEGDVYAVSVLSDGRILCGGTFESFNGTLQKSALRLTTVGDLDPTFAPQFPPGTGNGVFAIALQSDGQVLLAGAYDQINGSPVLGLARVDAYGITDGTFTNTHEGYFFSVAVADNGNVFAGGTLFNDVGGLVILDPSGGTIAANIADDAADRLERTPEGDVLCGGRFSGLLGGPGRLGRITADGALDAGFTSAVEPVGGVVIDLAIQPDGHILIAGDFTQVDGVSRNRLARLGSDGGLDTGFDPGSGFDAQVNAIALLPDGDILAGGPFTTYNGVPLNGNLVRLDANGALVTSYAGDATIFDIAVQTDGKVVVCGQLLHFGTAARHGIMRLMPDPGTGLTDKDPEMIPATYDPQSGSLVLMDLLNGSAGLTIRDMSGRTVLRIGRPGINDRIDVRALPVGIFLLEGRTDGRLFRSRFVKY